MELENKGGGRHYDDDAGDGVYDVKFYYYYQLLLQPFYIALFQDCLLKRVPSRAMVKEYVHS